METNSHLDVPFDTENEEGSPDFEPLPKNKYVAEIATASCGPTKNGAGYAVKLSWRITEGEFENRILFSQVLYQHESEEAQKIGRRKFKDIAVACGVNEVISDLSVVCHRPCVIVVVIRADTSGQYPDRNEIVRVLPLVRRGTVNGARPAADVLKEAQKPEPAVTTDKTPSAKPEFNDKIPF